MKQVIGNSSGVAVIRAPKPSVPSGWVLVRTKYSMISIGTEIAPLRATLAQTAEAVPFLHAKVAAEYLGKAMRDPKKAVRKVLGILQAKAEPLRARLRVKPEARPVDAQSLSWQFSNNVKHEQGANFGLKLISDSTEFGYQAWLGLIDVPEGFFPLVRFSGRIEGGSISIGVTSGPMQTWKVNNAYSTGALEDELAVVDASGQCQVIISNTGAKVPVILNLDNLEISFVEAKDAAYWRSELSDQGWGLGYSAAGEVAACGEGVDDLTVGQAVACCGAGWANHAEYIAVPRNMVCPVPEGCSLAEAASTTIGSIALQGVRRAAPGLGERVVVIGLGLIGLITVQLLKASGCKVFGFDLSESRVQKGLELGMDHGSADANTFALLTKKFTDNFGADKVMITAATKSNVPINQAMQLVRSKGTVVIVGDIGLAPERPQFYRKEVNLLMSTSYGAGRYDQSYELEGHDYPIGYARWTINRNMQAYMEQIACGVLNIKDMVERVINVDDAPAVYTELATGEGELPLSVLITYSEGGDEAAIIQIRGAQAVSRRNGLNGPARAALVGAGAYGISMLAPKMQALPEYYSLSGLVSADAVRGGNYVRQMRLPYLSSSIGEMASREDIDLLVIATRHKQHAAEVFSALTYGKAVFVEKPLATTWEDWGRLDELYKSLEQPPLLMVGFNRRFSPALEALRAELAQRNAPLMMLYRLNAGFIPPEHWVQTKEGAGRNIGEACHIYDVFRSLACAPVEEINAVAVTPESPLRLRSDNFTAALRYADGSQGTLMYTASGPKTGLPKERIEVFCDGEAYIVDDFSSLTRASDGVILWQGDVDKGHTEEFRLLGKALAEGGPAPIPFAEIMETSAVALYVEDLIHGRVAE